MKLLLIVIVAFMTVCASCSDGIKLEANQTHIIFDKNDGMTSLSIFPSYDVGDKTREKFFQDYFDKENKGGKLVSFKRQGDYGLLQAYYSDAKKQYPRYGNTLDDYLYGNIADKINFVYYKDNLAVNSNDIEKYRDLLVFYAHGGSGGGYYTFPGKLFLVEDTISYDKINNSTIFIQKNSYGVLVYEKN